MMLTRERVGNCRTAAQDSVSAALLRPECAEIRWRAAQLRQELGTAISVSNVAVRDALDTACRGLGQDSATAEELMLWLAGPYRLDKQTGWLFTEAEYSRRRGWAAERGRSSAAVFAPACRDRRRNCQHRGREGSRERRRACSRRRRGLDRRCALSATSTGR